MKFQTTTYNPFPEIVRQLPPNKIDITASHLDMIRRELFTAGIILENEEEFDKVLKILSDLEII